MARHKENVTDHSRTAVRRDSCSSGAKSFAPLRGKPPMARRNEKTRQKKNATFVSLQKTKVVSKTKVLKRKRQKIHISKHRVPICVARHKEMKKNLAHGSAQGFVLERSEELCPLRGKPPYGAPKRKQCNKRCFCRSGRSRYNFTKTKVLKRKRQKIHIFKHRIPFCVARHKENVTDHSRTIERRDSCSSGARSAKAAAGNDIVEEM